jgi:L-rhamnose mutarotase
MILEKLKLKMHTTNWQKFIKIKKINEKNYKILEIEKNETLFVSFTISQLVKVHYSLHMKDDLK